MNENLQESCPIQSINDVMNEILDKMYIGNVMPRLRALQSPTEIDQTRWIWELLQNAQDSVDPGRTVNAKVIFTNDGNLTFEHTGGVFTGKAMCGLLYKYSAGKANNEEKTGRFGTGFMTTLALSKIIKVETNIIEQSESNSVTGFHVILYRNGREENELKEGLKNMRKSMKKVEAFQDFTTRFEYKKANIKSVDFGYDSFIKCGAQTLIFAKKISEFTFNYKGKISSIQRKAIKDYENNPFIQSFDIVNGSHTCERSFIVISIEEPNELLSQKFKRERKLRLQIAVEFHDEEIKSHEKSTCLYCVFPFIGSEMHQLPFLMNCPDFEPDTERQALLLEGPDMIIDDGNETINYPLINKMILQRAVELFNQILKYLVQNNFRNFYLLTNGLYSNDFEAIPHMNPKWYKSEIIDPMRKLLEDSPIIKTIDNEMTILKEAYIPIYPNDADNEQRRMYHKVVGVRYPNKTITFEESENWANRVWENLHLIKINDLVEEEELGRKLFENNHPITQWEYLNLLLEYVKKYESTLLEKHAIIPDMNEERHTYSNEIYECKEVNEDMLNILDSISEPWKSQHMHNKITKINIHKHNMNDAIESCIQNIGENPLLSYVLSNYIPKDNSRRQSIFDFVNEILQKNIEPHYIENEIDLKLWKSSDEYLINEFLSNIKQFTAKDVKEKFELCHRFISFLNEQEIEKKYLTEHAIVPNQNFKLCKLNELRDKSNIPIEFKEGVLRYFNIDINDDELNDQITDIECTKHSKIANYQDKINALIDNKTDIDASIFLLCFTPSEKQIDLYMKIKNIRSIMIAFLSNQVIESIKEDNWASKLKSPIKIKVHGELLWTNAIKNIIEQMKTIINAFHTFDDYKQAFNLIDKHDEAIDLLNQCYKYERNIKIPTLDGKMNEMNPHDQSIFRSDGIDSNLIDLIIKVIADDPITSELAYPRIKHDKLNDYSTSQIIAKVKNITNMVSENPDLITDPEIMNLITAINKSSMDNFLGYGHLNSVEKEKLSIFAKLFVTNVGNRLRELENPSDNIQKRWGWELIQNAKDSIAFDSSKKINITFTYNKEHLVFKHNGNDFTLQQMLGLMYKFSAEKHEQKGSTGKFGTGFLTTHIISKKVILRGNLKNDNKLTGFEIALDRSGNKDSELMESMRRTEESKKELNAPIDCTSFEYPYDDEQHYSRVKKGIQNLHQNLPFTLLFSPQINSVLIENLDNNQKTEYTLLENGNPIKTVKITKNGEVKTRTFVVFHTEQCSPYVSEWYEKPNAYISLDASIEIDSNNSIVNNYHSELVYCAFPLIGCNLQIPCILNCPDFETTTERDNLFLKKSNNEESNTDKINYDIFTVSLGLYDQIIDYCIQNKISNLFYLAKGLNQNKTNSDYFHAETFQNVFLKKAREILCKHPVFYTINGFKMINEATLLLYSYPTKDDAEPEKQDKFYKDFYELVKRFYLKSNPLEYQESRKWTSFLWSDLNPVTHSSLLDSISKCGSIQNLPFDNEDDQIQFINDTINYVLEYDKVKLDCIKLTPNQNSIFCLVNAKLYFGPDVDEVAADLIHRLDGQWRENHVHRRIVQQNYAPTHTIQDAEIAIKNLLRNEFQCILVEKALILMEYIIPGDEDRIRMCHYSHLFLNTPESKIELKGFSTEIWKLIDIVMLQQIMQVIASKRCIQYPIESVEWLNNFILFAIEKGIKSQELKSCVIFPNQDNNFIPFGDLYKDEILNEEIKNALDKYCGLNIRKDLLHPDFDIGFDFQPKYLKDYSASINKYLEPILLLNVGNRLREEYTYNNHQIQFSIILIKFLGEDCPRQKEFIKACNVLLSQNMQEVNLKSSITRTTFEHLSQCLSYSINKKLFEYKTIENLSFSTGREMDEIIDSLNIVYEFSMRDAYVPNRANQFCSYQELSNITDPNPNFSDMLEYQISFSKLLNAHDESLDKKLVHTNIKCPLIRQEIDFARMCQLFDKLIYSKYHDIIKDKTNNPLKKLLDSLIDYIEEKQFWDYFIKLNKLRTCLIADYIINKEDRHMLSKIKSLPESRRKLIEKILENKELFAMDPYYFNHPSNMSFANDNYLNDMFFNLARVFDSFNQEFHNRYSDFSGFSKDEFIKRIGYTGEAYAYETLSKLGKVYWVNLSNKPERFQIHYNGHVYPIKESFDHYDIRLVTENGHIYYYEVKSTMHGYGRSFEVSSAQMSFLQQEEPNCTKRVMFVFDTLNNPWDIQIEIVSFSSNSKRAIITRADFSSI